jgi:dienelactone hydrolase
VTVSALLLLQPAASAAAAAGGAVPTSASLPDPMALGPTAVKEAHYEGGQTVLVDPAGATYLGEIAGSAAYPSPGQPGGPFPVVLLIHGNHGTCTLGGADAVGWPCPSTPASEQIPSHAGYRGLAVALASHGYIVLSLDANAVNTYNVAGDKGANERAQLLERTLDMLGSRNVAAPAPSAGTTGSVDELGGDLVGRVDLTRIGMMGHSRGGEAVNTAIEHLRARTDGPTYDGALKAVISLAGTDYNLPVTSRTNLATILPLCDGDVYDLQSVFAYDRHHLDDPATPFAHTLWSIGGTNHNYFNTVWTGDDYGGSDPACSRASSTSVRLQPAEQRAVGYALMASYLRRYVGPEPAFDPYVTGAAPLPSSACPVTQACTGLVKTSYLAPGAQRTFVGPARPGAEALSTSALGEPLAASGWATFSSCDPHADNGHDGNSRDPGAASGCPTNPHRSRTRQWTLAWDTEDAVLSLPLPADAVPAPTAGEGEAVLGLRVAPNFQDTAHTPAGGPDLLVTVVDVEGRRATEPVSAHATSLVPPPGGDFRKQTLDGVRIPLAAYAAQGVDVDHLAAVELSPGSPVGSVQVGDLVLQREAYPAALDDDPTPVVPEAPRVVLLVLTGVAVTLAALRRRASRGSC